MPAPELAESYGRDVQFIYNFTNQYRTQIDELIREMGDKFADLWIANKHTRVAEIQADYEARVELMRGMEEKADEFGIDHLMWDKHAQAKAKLRREAAEELSQLSTRTPAPVSDHNPKLYHTIEGVDLNKAMGLVPTPK